MLKIQQRHAMKQQTLANTNKPPAPPPPLIPSGTPTKQDSSAMNGKCFENVVYHRQPKLAQCASSANMKICLYCAVGEVQCKDLCPNERRIGIRWLRPNARSPQVSSLPLKVKSWGRHNHIKGRRNLDQPCIRAILPITIASLTWKCQP